MLRLLNASRIVQPPIIEYKDLKIERVLEYDDRTLSFLITPEYFNTNPELKHENFLQTKDDEYTIKSIDKVTDDTGSWYTITGRLNIDELEGAFFETFNTTEKTIVEAMQLALAGTGWTVQSSLTRKRTLKLTNKYTWDIFKQAVKTYRVEPVIDSLNKNITFVEKRGSDKGVYFSDQLNLKSVEIKSDTSTFFTRILPVGKDGLTIESVNGGSKYLNNFTYSKKVKTFYWKDERYTNPESLRDDASAKLDDMANPYTSYACSVIDLAKSNAKDYKMLGYDLGDTVTLIDNEGKTKKKQRITKLIEYPDDIEADEVEISNCVPTFDELAQKYDDAADIVDNITSDDGTVSASSVGEGYDAYKLSNIEDVIAGSGTFKTLNTEILNVSGKITAVEIVTGDLKTNKLDADEAYIKFATIGRVDAVEGKFDTFYAGDFSAAIGDIKDLTVDVEKVNTLMFGNATGGTLVTEFANSVVAVLGTAQIKSAMIESIIADQITGNLNSSKVNVLSEDGKLSIIDNTILIKDENLARIQIGKDALGDYNMYVWDSAGRLMFDALGITSDGITRPVIRDEVVMDDADISAWKLNIDSIFSVINEDGTHTINGSHIFLDTTSQTLDVAFENMTTQVDDLSNTVSTQGTELSIVQGSISGKIWQSDIVEATSQLVNSTDFDMSIGNVTARLSYLETTQETDESKIAEFEVKFGEISASISETYATKDSLKNYVTTSTMDSAIIQSANSISASVSSTYATKDSLGKYLTKQSAEAEFTLKIDKTDTGQIVSMINASADTISLSSNRFSLSSTYATIETNGKVKFMGGQVGNWTISEMNGINPGCLLAGDRNGEYTYLNTGAIVVDNKATGTGCSLKSNGIMNCNEFHAGIIYLGDQSLTEWLKDFMQIEYGM